MTRGTVLKKDFFERPVLRVAPEILGKFLVRKFPSGKIERFLITEVEAYDGEKDLACHASRGRTKRTEVMYGEAGHFYVYLCYGMYFMLNIVTGKKDYPSAILIRGLGEIELEKPMKIKNVYKGPGVLTRELKIDQGFNVNGKIALPKTKLWIEDRGVKIPKNMIKRTPRIGVSYAKEWKNKPYRFLIESI